MKTAEVLSVTIPRPLLSEAKALAKRENRTMSELVREALRQYRQLRRWEEITAYGRMTAGRAGVRDMEDVVRTIHEYREEQPKRRARTRR
jgi:metal-responsive CopG/Arc/MetJ family transcriptional regulator